jgi:hypothetical protein
MLHSVHNHVSTSAPKSKIPSHHHTPSPPRPRSRLASTPAPPTGGGRVERREEWSHGGGTIGGGRVATRATRRLGAAAAWVGASDDDLWADGALLFTDLRRFPSCDVPTPSNVGRPSVTVRGTRCPALVLNRTRYPLCGRT